MILLVALHGAREWTSAIKKRKWTRLTVRLCYSAIGREKKKEYMVVDQLIIYSLAIENAGLDTESTSGCQGRELIIWKELNSLQLTTSCDNVAFFFIKAGYFSTASSSVAFSRRLIALAPSIRKHFIMVRLFFFL